MNKLFLKSLIWEIRSSLIRLSKGFIGCAIVATFAERWSKRLQVIRLAVPVYQIITNNEERNNLRDGDEVHRPTMTALYAKTLASTAQIQRHTIATADESLVVNQKKEVSFFVEDFNKIQDSIGFTDAYATHVGKVLVNQIDGAVLGEYEQADSRIGAYEIAGSGSLADGLGFTLTVSNILKAFSLANRKLDRLNIAQDNRWAILSGEFKDILYQYISGKDTALGDSTGKNGHIGKYAGFNLYLSNACAWSGELVFNAVAGESEVVILNGVTFLWNASMGSAEGNLNICDTATNEAINFKNAINDPGTSIAENTATGYIKLEDADSLRAMEGFVATESTGTLSLVVEGKGWIAVSETLADAASVFTTAKEVQHLLFGQGKPIDLVIQKFPKIEVQVRSGYIGRDFITWDLYGLKTFDEGDAQLCDILSRSEGF